MMSHAKDPEIPLPLNKKQLAQQMGISESTLRRLLKNANLVIGRGLIAPTKQDEVLKALGWRELTQDDAK